MLKKLVLTSLLVILPGMASSVPMVSIKSTDIVLSSNVVVTALSGPALTSSDTHYSTSLFADGGTHAQVNADIDDPVVVSADASITNLGGNYFTMMTNAEFNWGMSLPGPLPLATTENSLVEAVSSLKSTFTVTGDEQVDFSAIIVNNEGNLNGSKGTLDLTDMSTGVKLLSLDDSSVFEEFLRESVFLQPGHTYKLSALSINRTGGDDEIYTEFCFNEAAISVPAPASLLLLNIGILTLGLIRLGRPDSDCSRSFDPME